MRGVGSGDSVRDGEGGRIYFSIQAGNQRRINLARGVIKQFTQIPHTQ